MNAFSPFKPKTGFPLPLLAAALLAVGCGQTTPDRATGDPAELFRSSGCAGCHALARADARGPVGPSLDDTDLDRDEIALMIRSGGRQMPSFEDRLSSAEIDSLSGLIATDDR